MSRETINDILLVSKDIYNYIKYPSLMTKNDVSGQVLVNSSKTFKKLDELKAMFEETSKPSSSKGGKATVKVRSPDESSKSPSPRINPTPPLKKTPNPPNRKAPTPPPSPF